MFVNIQVRQALDIIHCLIKQVLAELVKRNWSCPNDIRDAIETYFGPSSQPGEPSELVRDVLDPLLAVVGPSRLIIHGLDECDASEATVALHILGNLIHRGLVRLLISSRESVGVNQVIPATETIWITFDYTCNDIATLTNTLIDAKSRDGVLIDDNTVIDHVRDALCREAQGMSVYLNLLIGPLSI